VPLAVNGQIQELYRLLSYDAAAGRFDWKIGGGRRILGRQPGYVGSDGYRYVRAAGQRIAAHRLAWLFAHGSMPTEEIDHINGIRLDNRITNLRTCVRSENARNKRIQSNNVSGFPGVCYVSERGGKWRAYVVLNRRMRWLGRFDSYEAAVAARVEGEKKYYGAFAPEH
jgi:Demerecviridae HNH endonuclease